MKGIPQTGGMKKVSLVLAVVLVIAIAVVYALRKGERSSETETTPTVSTDDTRDSARDAQDSKPADSGSVSPDVSSGAAPSTETGKVEESKTAGVKGDASKPAQQTKSPETKTSDSKTIGAKAPSAKAEKGTTQPSASDEDEFDDGGDFPVVKKTPIPTTPAGVKSAKLWWVASDLKSAAFNPGSGQSFEIGTPEGSKATPWQNRAGAKIGNGVRVKSGGNATFVPEVATTTGSYPAVLICGPSARGCKNSQPSQIKLGPDVNHAEHWLSGPDRAGKSERGGSSFTALFVASRAAASANSLLEHQNGEAGSTKGPFLGWIGSDIVASIHGSQGAVGVSAVALPNPWAGKATPQVFTVRYDRKSSKLDLFFVGEKGSEMKSLALEKGDGPDNDEYIGIAIGSKNARDGAAYVFEQATYSRALSDQEICSIHREWATQYGLKPAALKPCQ
jgi:hypothetical protein